MKASVIIITKNQKGLLQRLLPILLNQEFSGGYEIIVVDSGSTDGAKEYVKTLDVKLVEIASEKFKFARAFNIGATHATGEYLVRLSGDVIPKHMNFLTEMVEPFTSRTVGGTYGKYTQTGKKGYSHPNFWGPERFPDKKLRFSLKPNFYKFLFGKDNEYTSRLTNFAGGCCSIRRSIWLRRHFNERLLSAEDAEYAIYLHLKGFDVVYNPKAEVIHEHKIQHLNAGFWREKLWRIVFMIEVLKLFIRGA